MGKVNETGLLHAILGSPRSAELVSPFGLIHDATIAITAVGEGPTGTASAGPPSRRSLAERAVSKSIEKVQSGAFDVDVARWPNDGEALEHCRHRRCEGKALRAGPFFEVARVHGLLARALALALVPGEGVVDLSGFTSTVRVFQMARGRSPPSSATTCALTRAIISPPVSMSRSRQAVARFRPPSTSANNSSPIPGSLPKRQTS